MTDVPGQHNQVLPGRGEVFGWFTRFLSYTGKGRAFCLLLNFGHGPWCVGHVRSQCLDQGSNLCPLHGKCWVLTTGPPRKSHIFFSKWHPFSGGVERRGESPDCTILSVSDTWISLAFSFSLYHQTSRECLPLVCRSGPVPILYFWCFTNFQTLSFRFSTISSQIHQAQTCTHNFPTWDWAWLPLVLCHHWGLATLPSFPSIWSSAPVNLKLALLVSNIYFPTYFEVYSAPCCLIMLEAWLTDSFVCSLSGSFHIWNMGGKI